MKKKVFFIISSLNAGGAEKVFWLLSQHFNKTLYEVTIILLNGKKTFFSKSLEGVSIIDLKTRKASLSFFKLLKLLRKERPYAIYATGGQINALLGFTSFFINIPILIARPANVADIKVTGFKSKLLSSFLRICYCRCNTIVCQSEEIKASLINKYNISSGKMVIIPNPVLPSNTIKHLNGSHSRKQIVIVGRLAKQKGHERLLEIFEQLPENYTLTIAGDGPLKNQIAEKIELLGLRNRVKMLGLVSDITDLVAKHDLFVLPSYFEGFPNAVVEALSVGTPVVAFKVGGISAIVKDDFNGYIVEQDDLQTFKDCIIKGVNKHWNHGSIRQDASDRFSIGAIVNNYEKLIA